MFWGRFSNEAFEDILEKEKDIPERALLLEYLLSVIELNPFLVRKGLIKWKLVNETNLLYFIQSLNLNNAQTRLIAEQIISTLNLKDPSIIRTLIYILQKNP